MTNTSYTHDEIKSRLSAGNSWHNSAESFVFVSDKQKVKICVQTYNFALNLPLCAHAHVCMREKLGLIYRVSQEERAKLRDGVPYVKLYRYNPKHLYPKFNGYGDNGHRKVWASGVSTYCTPSMTPYSPKARAQQQDIVMQ